MSPGLARSASSPHAQGVVGASVYANRMSFMRSFIAFTLLLIAVGLGFAAMGAHWVDRVARTPAPMQEIIGPLASNEGIGTALTQTLTEEATKAIPTALVEMPIVGEQVIAIINQAAIATLADPGVQRAWNESINLSRSSYVAALDDVHGDETLEAPTIWFDLAPFASLGKSKLLELSPAALHPSLEEIEFADVRLSLGQPSESITGALADGVNAARAWPWLYLASAVAALVALLVGSRRGRWIALLLAGVIATVGTWFGRSQAEAVTFQPGDSLAATIRTQIVEGGTSHFLSFTEPGLYVAYAMVGLGVLGLLLTALKR